MSPQDKKIALFSLAWVPFEGGAEIAARAIAERLPHQAMVFTHRFDSRWLASEVREPLTVERVGRGKIGGSYYGRTLGKWFYVFLAWRAAERAHAKQPFDYIWAIMASYGGIAALLFKFRHPRIPFLLTLQEGDSEEHILRRVGIFYPLWKQILSRADRIQTISAYLADFAKRQGARCPINIVPNGVDILKFEALNPKSETNSKSKNPNIKTIITTSRLVHKNGIDTLIRAFSELINRKSLVVDCRLVIVGDGPLRPALEKLVAKLKVADRVQFVGHIPAEEIQKYLAGADIFVRASRSEGLGSSFLEAMAAGLPVIGTPVGGIPDFLKEGETGLFTRPDDHRELAEKIAELLMNAPLRRKLIQNGKALVHRRYSWDRIVREMQGVFSSLQARERIIIVSGILPPEVGGPAYYAEGLQQAFKEGGAEVLMSGYGWLKRLPTGVRHIFYVVRLLPSFVFWQPTFVVALDMFSVGLPAVLLGKITGVPVIVRTGGDFLWEFYVERTREKVLLSEFYVERRALTGKEKMIFRLTRWTLLRASLTVFSTAYQRDIFVPAYGLDRARTAIVENRYDTPAESGKPSQKNFICFARPLVWKNTRLLARAFEKARAIHPEIILETGALSRESYLEKVKTCYAVILVSLGDISPNMILEALSYGKPFILTKENGLENRISGIGLRVDPRDEVAVAHAISELADPRIYKREQEKIRDFSFRHSYADIAREFLKISRHL